MALVVRQALLRNRAFNRDSGMDQDALENRAALIREEDLRRLYDEEEYEDAEANRELEEKRRAEARELKRQLMERKREKISSIKKRMKINDTLASVLSIAGVVIAFIELEDNYSETEDKERNESSPQGHGLRAIVMVTTLILALLTARHHMFSYKIARERQTTSEGVGSTFVRSIQFRWMWLELLLVLIHCPPGIDAEFTFEQLNGTLILSLDSICSCVMLLRFYIIFRLIKLYSKFANDHADEVCENYGCEANTMFVLKSIFKEKPYLILGFCMGLSICIFGLATRVFERPYNQDNGKNYDFDYVWNAMWLIVLTMTTVGYGEIVPLTHMGRFVVIIACFWGVFLVSMMVVTLTESSEFTKGEGRAYDILSRLKAKEQATRIARKVVTYSLQLNYIKRTKKNDPHYNDLVVRKYNEMMRALSKFRQHRSEWKKWELPVEEMLRQLNEKIDVDLEELKSQIASVVEIEQQLQRVENFQDQSLDATRISLVHLEELEGQLDKLIGN